ncbi:CgeB family protein [Halodurantibacterium flavum]|uniref:Glycosyltransferase n=1 Tax=Halodurantibacterium flavum TaxID=1382802 RepID=A0ABW4S5A9_9RHOB
MTYDLVFVGLSLSSSWGNGHATTYRALLRGLHGAGQRVLFLERDVPWYAGNRDLAAPDFCDLALYDSVEGLIRDHAETMRSAGSVVIGSYVPEGQAVIDAVAALRPRQLCFYDIDTPVTMQLLRGGDETWLARRQVPVFDIYFSFAGGEVLDRLEREYGAGRAEALYCSVDADHYRRDGSGTPRWDMGYLGTYSDDRQPKLEALLLEPARQLPEMRFVVAGSQYPDGIDWPANVERIAHLPPADHPAFYRSQRFTLNVTRADMVAAGWSPSVRLFEAAACGTPIISDHWRGLDSLLPEDEAVLIARETDDVIRFLTTMDEAQRQRIADRAEAIIRDQHTGAARARQMLAALTPALPKLHSAGGA